MVDDFRTFHIYIDETSKSASFTGIGALFTRRDSGRDIAQMMSDAVVEHGQRPDKEVHWTELKGHLLPLYSEIGEKLVAYTQVKPTRMRYHALIVETANIDRSINSGLNREETLARFIFTLIFSFAANFGMRTSYHVFIDSADGEERSDGALKAMLNNKCFSHFKERTNPFQTVRHVRSENSRLIQAVDLLSGAVAYETNSLHLADRPAPYRYQLWSRMLKASNLPTFARPTSQRLNRFQIRHFDFAKSSMRRMRNPRPPASDAD